MTMTTTTTIIATDHECNNEAAPFASWINSLDLQGLNAETSDDYADATDSDLSQELWSAYCENNREAAVVAVAALAPDSVTYAEVCSALSLSVIEQENALLQIGREFLPSEALLVIDGATLSRKQARSYNRFCIEQLLGSLRENQSAA